MWKSLTESLDRIWLELHKASDERQTEKARARFWAEVRKGQQEAETADRRSARDAKDVIRESK
jgi:hypothetical protein